jgi:hypothetical protein
VRLACFILVRRLESLDWCSARLPGRGNFLSMIEEAMSMTPIIFVLVIFLFGFDSAGKSRPDQNTIMAYNKINLVAFKDIPRASHPTKEVVPVVPRVATKFPSHAP